MITRAALFTVVSALPLLLAAPVWAQDAGNQGAAAGPRASPPDDGGDDAPAEVDEVVVTGSRAPGRSRLETVAPVDVVTAEALAEQGTTELAEALSVTTPSVNFPRPAITDATDVIRPATLRGLAPDQTLVLVNSARRHQTALVNVNGSIGRGSAAVDLNAIPTSAIDRVEVLREGASALYGSDAIAGVINIRLREERSGGGVTATVGQYRTTVDTFRIPEGREENDGTTVTVSGWQGLPLGADGFVTVSAEYRDREPTSRGDLDVRVNPPRITSRYGDPRVEDATLYLNAGLPLAGGYEVYGWAGYQHREGESAAFPRIVGDPRNVPAIYPNGFLPKIASTIDDYTAAAGVRGQVAGFDVDLNLVYGRNEIDYRTENSVNVSRGAASPTSFDSGGLTYDQIVLGLDFVRRFEVGLAEPVNLAFGLESRRETYGIRAGEPASYDRGPFPGAQGAQGFPGFLPSNEVDVDRSNVGAYVDVEAQITPQFLTAASGRVESYSDFGSTSTGRLSARYDFTPAVAVRGSLTTGFRAPGLQQAFFTATSTNFINGLPFEIGTFPATSPTAQVLGSRPLEPEESVNYALGTVFRRGRFELTVDAYRIDVTNRIVLSENIQGIATGTPTQREIFRLLQPFGASTARFFINGVDTETKGVDLVARWRLEAETAGNFEFIVAANVNETDVTRVPTSNALSTLPAPPVIFGRVQSLTFEQGTPREKLVLSTDWDNGPLGGTVRLTHYGSALQPGTAANGSLDIITGDQQLLDLEGRYRFPFGLGLAIGVDNVFDKYPNINFPHVNATNAVAFSQYSPFGFNGRFVYARLNYGW
ncbi:MAG: TonB-dependent receptor [Proteobacteria bacterium]|nr:TonB-dependent receptor [Pseudomonadota bacterium]